MPKSAALPSSHLSQRTSIDQQYSMESSSSSSFLFFSSFLFLSMLIYGAGAHITPADYLNPQNAARAALGLPPLVWDHNVAAYAQWYASVREGDCRLQHSDYKGPYFGENIFEGDGDTWTPEDAVRDWVAERKYYDHHSNTCIDGQECGHYTQIVWRETRKVGCARVECARGGIFITCNYSPPGNFEGQRPY